MRRRLGNSSPLPPDVSLISLGASMRTHQCIPIVGTGVFAERASRRSSYTRPGKYLRVSAVQARVEESGVKRDSWAMGRKVIFL